MKKLFFSLATMLVVTVADAAVIYTQTPSPGGGHLSARMGVGGSAYDEFVWDSFAISTNVTLREIQWRGTRTGSMPTSFQVSINTIAIPGGTIWNISTNASETATGTPGVYDYRFTLPAGFVLTGGQKYWLQVFATQNEIPNWQWLNASGGDGSHIAQVPAVTGDYRFVLSSGDTAFSLLNAATVPVTITVAKSPSAGGTVTGGGTYVPGTNVTVTAKAASGRTFLNWTEAGAVVSTSTNYSFIVDGTKTLTANFSGPNTGPYVISAVPNPGVYGNVGGAGTYNAGDVADLDVTPADGLSFVGWTENGLPVTLPYSGGVFPVTANSNRNLVANFSYPAYTIFIYGTVAPNYSGTVVISNTAGLSSGSYYGGTMISFVATPYAGYHFAYWQQGAGLGDLSGAPHMVSTNPVLNHMVCYGTTITANFQPDFPVLTLNVSPAASGTVSGGGTYANGSSVAIHATPAIGYAFVNWKSGITIVSTSPTEVLYLTNHTDLTATFVPKTNTITANAAPVAGGSVAGAGIYGNGATVTLTAIPTEGYVFTNWTIGGAFAGTNESVTFDAFNNYDFVANFVLVANHAPYAFGGNFYQLTNTPLAINISDLMWSDYDPDGDSITFVGVSATSTSGLPLTTTATQILVPANAVADSLSYTISDSHGATATGTATISIIMSVDSQAISLDLSAPGNVVASFSGVPWYAYEAQRATNVFFTGSLQTWPVQAWQDGSIYLWDDFADLTNSPPQAFYRLRFNP